MAVNKLWARAQLREKQARLNSTATTAQYNILPSLQKLQERENTDYLHSYLLHRTSLKSSLDQAVLSPNPRSCANQKLFLKLCLLQYQNLGSLDCNKNVGFLESFRSAIGSIDPQCSLFLDLSCVLPRHHRKSLLLSTRNSLVLSTGRL